MAAFLPLAASAGDLATHQRAVEDMARQAQSGCPREPVEQRRYSYKEVCGGLPKGDMFETIKENKAWLTCSTAVDKLNANLSNWNSLVRSCNSTAEPAGPGCKETCEQGSKCPAAHNCGEDASCHLQEALHRQQCLSKCVKECVLLQVIQGKVRADPEARRKFEEQQDRLHRFREKGKTDGGGKRGVDKQL